MHPKFKKAILLFQKREFKGAKNICDEILEIEPKNFDVMHLYGIICYQTKDYALSAELINKAVKINSNNAEAYNNLGIAFKKLNKFDSALESLNQAIKINPKFFEAYNIRGLIFIELERLNEALESLNKALEINPNYAEAYYNQGNLLCEMKKFNEAISSYNKAIKINPNYSKAYNNLGIAFKKLKKSDSALESFNKAVEINPNFAEAYNNQGNVLCEMKKFNEALSCYNKTIKINPNFAEAYNNRANILNEFKKFNEALEDCNKVIKINPKNAQAYNNRAIIQNKLEQHNMAIESLNLAIQYNPNYAEAYYNQGNLLCEMKKFNEAISSYNKAIKINPNLDYLLGRLIFSKHCISEWKSFAKDLKDISDKILKKYKICTPLQSLRFFDSPELQKITAQTYVKEKYSDKNDLIHITNKKLNKKIRIGYYSADFYNHAMSSLLTNLYELHDKSKFELFAFSFGPERKDEMYYRISAAFDQFIDVKLKSDDEIMKLSRELKIDVAIDLMTFTQYHRFEIFTKRCAPIQINYLGYPGTSGASCFDYIIADKTLIPKKNQKYYSEKIIYLPDTYQVNDSKRKISDKVFTRKELSLPKDSFVFCCFNQSSKINPEIFYIWMNLLKSINNSVLWILPQNEIAVKNLQKEATIRNVNPDRIKFAQDMEMSEHLARHKAADLFIDTFPYNAHTTASDALWAGLPVLTLMGESFASRVAGSLLNAIDLPELITHTKKEYEDKAIELANNKSLLNEIRNKLNKNRLIKPLFNTKLFTKNLEKAYLMIYEKYINNKKPENIEIK